MVADAESVFAPLVAAAERAGLADFLRWWRSELAAMLPAGWRERLASRDTAYLGAEGDELHAFRPHDGRLVHAGQVSLASLDAAGRRNAFRRLLAGEQGAAGNVWLVLPPESVLAREVHLPLAAEEALRDAVGFELDRLTPLPSEHAWFDYRVTGRDASSQQLTLNLVVVARPSVEARLAELRELGATVLGVGVADDIAVAPTPFNLLPQNQRDHPATSGVAIAARSLALVASMLLLAILVYPLWLKREAVIALSPRMDKARAGADVADRLAKEIEKLATEHNFLIAKKQGQQPVVSILEDLSRLLPDTTWVQQLEVRSGAKVREVQIAGETGSSSQLIEVLERSGTLANATFKSPLTKGATPNTERFLVAAEVKPRPLPDPIPEDALAVKAPAAAGAPAAPGAPAAGGDAVPAPVTTTAPGPAPGTGASPASNASTAKAPAPDSAPPAHTAPASTGAAAPVPVTTKSAPVPMPEIVHSIPGWPPASDASTAKSPAPGAPASTGDATPVPVTTKPAPPQRFPPAPARPGAGS